LRYRFYAEEDIYETVEHKALRQLSAAEPTDSQIGGLTMYQQKPTGVTIIAVLFFIAGALAVLGGVYVLAAPIPSVSFFPDLTSYQIVIGIVMIIIGGIDIAVGWGLWTLQNWARITAIVMLALSAVANLFTGVGLLVGVNIGGYPVSLPGPGVASLLTTGIGAWLIWYLLKPEVAAAFFGQDVFPVPPTVAATAPPPPPPPVHTASPPPIAPVPSVRPPREPTIPIGAQPAPEGWLVLRSGPRSGQQFGLKRGRNTIGRDSTIADIVIQDETVSGEHARIQFEQGQFYIYDLASTNGTSVNNRRIQRQMLMDGDVVHLGDVQVVFKHVA
jgi:hypothetical protein